MRIFVNQEIRRLFLAMAAVLAALALGGWLLCGQGAILLLTLLAGCCILGSCFFYFRRQDKIMEEAVARMNAFLAGEKAARIDCDREGEIYRLFHCVNTLATVLNAHVEKETQAREFLKRTISDISHQLKTPLAALNIYNGLLQEETRELPGLREFAVLSERELDRMEALVQNLLRLTRLDAGTLVMEKTPENVAEMMKDVQLQFAWRAGQEGKEIRLSGDEAIMLCCDRDWLMEAVGNVVKNALDHTGSGGLVQIRWERSASLLRLTIADNGTGIHPEDIHYIFKRFYRSRFSQDTQGIGLGLSLAKAIVEAHGGSLTADSRQGQGSIFTISLLNPTKL